MEEIESEEIESEEMEAGEIEAEEFEVNINKFWQNPDGTPGFLSFRVLKDMRSVRVVSKATCLDYYEVCKNLLEEVQDAFTQVKFNRCQCQLVVSRYATSICSLIELKYDPSVEDRLMSCWEEPLRQLMCVMCRGVMLVTDCMREDWWASVIFISECSSFSTHIALHLEDFISCVDTVKMSFAEATGDLLFSVPPNIDKTKLSALVEEASQKDNTNLSRIGECITDVGDGSTAMKLAKCFMQARLRSKLSLEPSDVFFQPGADMLGVGASGTVRIATWNGRSVAVKLINDKHRMQGEAMMLESLAHPNVVKLIGLGLVKDSQEGLLVLELMRTSLRNLINTRSETLDGGRQPPFEMYTAIDIMLQIAVAMRYFHEHGILHCDMKASNVLVNDEDLTSLGHVQIKVTDFGLSRNIGSKVPVSLQNAGTPGWMAPEFFERRQDVPYTQASDVFSFAVTCSEILTGEVPFKDVHPDGLYQKLVAGERPCLPDNNFPQYLKQYIGMCWANNPEERPSFDQICEMLRFCRGFYIRNRLGSATTLASVNEHDAWELASRLSFDYCLHADNGLKFSKELVYYPLIYAATEGRLRYDREDLVKAQVEAGRYYGDWVGSWQDWQKAVTLFARAADEGDPEALWRLGLCYELGIGTPEETEITRPVPLLYRMAIERGCVSGHVELGLCYALGTCGLPRDPEKAVQSWKAAKVEQLIRGECIPSISDMVRYVSTDRSLDSDTAVHARGRTMAGKRLRELTSEHSVARRLVAGPGNCNVGPLLQAGHDGRSLHQDLVITLHNLSQEKRIRSTFQKYKKDIEKRGTYWTLMGAISSGPSLLQQVCGCMSEAIYFLSFIVVLPMLLFLLLAFRASGIKIVVFLLIIAPLLYMFLLVVCFLCLLQDNNSNHQREESDDQKEDSGIQRLLEEPEEHIGLEETRTNQSETQEQNETERNGKVSSIQCLPPIFFFMLAVIFLFIQRKLGFVCFIISVLYMFGVGIYEEFVREPGPDSDSDDDQ